MRTRPREVRARSLAELAAHLGAPAPDLADGGPQVRGISLSTRTVQPGDLYAALPGSRSHGADHADTAAAAGAVAVLTDPEGQGALQFGISGVPETYVIDGNGIIREHLRGELTLETIEARLLPLLQGAQGE